MPPPNKNHNTSVLLNFSNETYNLYASLLEDKFSSLNVDNTKFKELIQIFCNKINHLKSKTIYIVEPNVNNLFFTLLKKELKSKIIWIPNKYELFILHNIFTTQKEVEFIFYLESICPLLDLDITEKLLSIHAQYGAEFAFAENIPDGLVPSIFKRNIIDIFELLDEEIFTKKQALSIPLVRYIQKNINKFHVEIYYDEPDLRMLRLNFNCSHLVSIIQTYSLILEINTINTPFKELESLLQQKPELIHTFPSYIDIELISNCEYKCIFCPREYIDVSSSQLNLEQIDTILNYTKTLPKVSIALGGLGEPLQHDNILKILLELLNQQNIHTLVLETNGFYLDKIVSLINNKNFNKLKVIFNVNSLEKYSDIHGFSGLEKITLNLEQWSNKIKESNIQYLKNQYIQTLKINENEKEIDALLHFAESFEFNFLLQKYNSYVNTMPERRVSDMTPLTRFPCWHLRQDLFIRANGDVVFCKQDIQNKIVRGNIKKDPLNEIWCNTKKDWQENYQEKYNSTLNCIQCDEYFTFNL